MTNSLEILKKVQSDLNLLIKLEKQRDGETPFVENLMHLNLKNAADMCISVFNDKSMQDLDQLKAE